MIRTRRLLPFLAVVGCSGAQSTLEPVGRGAEISEGSWWLLLWVCTGVFVIVVALLLRAIARRRAERPQLEARAERRTVAWVLIGGAALPLVVLVLLFVHTMRTLAALEPAEPGRASIEVIGHQYWWQVRYLDERGAVRFETANEIHVPVNRRVSLRLEAADVIHSLWVPRLHGKLDMIPGRTNLLELEALAPGVYRGQCAEYCGLQHTHMALMVVAQPEDEYRRWLAAQTRPARPPSDSAAAAGLSRFMAHCAECHTIRGTPADGAEGPDLTHVGSRLTLAAGMLPNGRGSLGGWIANPQVLKPGNKMPRLRLRPDELISLVDYLSTLE